LLPGLPAVSTLLVGGWLLMMPPAGVNG